MMYMQSDDANENGTSKNIVHATREDLFDLLMFLESKLPRTCPIHSFVLSAIHTRSSSYHVYFMGDRTMEANSYTAILGARHEHKFDSKKMLKTCWIISTWEESDPVQLCEIFAFLPKIDWGNDSLIWFGNGEVANPTVLKHIEQHKGMKLEPDSGSPCYQYYLPPEEAIAQQIDTRQDVYVKSLEQEHASVVYEHWPYRETTTIADVKIGIDLLPSAGVFLKENDELVSWMMSYPPNGMSRLHTKAQYRRKGYAKLLTQYLSKRVAQSGSIPFVNIVHHNAASVAFFESIGFRLICPRFVYLSNPILVH